MISRVCIAGFFAVLLGACGGGGDVVTLPSPSTVDIVTQPSTPGNTREQSTTLLLAYLSSANEVKYQQYGAAASANTFTFATSIGARVTGNSALYQSNKMAFEAAVNSFLSGFLLRLDEVSKTYPIDASRLALELDVYQQNDVENMKAKLSASARNGVDTSVVSALYQAGKIKVLTYN